MITKDKQKELDRKFQEEYLKEIEKEYSTIGLLINAIKQNLGKIHTDEEMHDMTNDSLVSLKDARSTLDDIKETISNAIQEL